MATMTSTTAFAKGKFGPPPEFEQSLDRLAEVAVRAGLGLAPGQELVMTATLDAVPLARRITEHAYRAGASLVTTLFTDEQSALLRFRYGADASFDTAPSWLYDGMAQAFRNGAARLAITGNDPSLLSKEDPEKVSRVNRATSKAYRPALELITATRSIGPSYPAPLPRGRGLSSPISPRTKRWLGFGTPSLPRRAWTGRIQWPHGESMTRVCTLARTG
jgi:hypothetical protein